MTVFCGAPAGNQPTPLTRSPRLSVGLRPRANPRVHFRNEIAKGRWAKAHLPFGTPAGNRTRNGPLGGGCYIHLTTEAFISLTSARREYFVASLLVPP